jgi:elongation factor P
MASTADFRPGYTFKYNNDLVSIIEFQHVKPGKGPAFVRTKLRSLTTGKVLDNTFNSGVKVEEVRIERRKYQYLYPEDNGYHFMNSETFEQIFIEKHMIESPDLLQEGTYVEILFHAEEELPLQVDMPATIIATVTYTEPGVKGDTATNTLKPATLDTGAEIKVPLFISEGDKVKVDTKTRAYVERVKE